MWQNWLFFLTVLALGVNIPEINRFFDERGERKRRAQLRGE
jgi:hypothetical protein